MPLQTRSFDCVLLQGAIAAHLAEAERLKSLAECLTRSPNMISEALTALRAAISQADKCSALQQSSSSATIRAEAESNKYAAVSKELQIKQSELDAAKVRANNITKSQSLSEAAKAMMHVRSLEQDVQAQVAAQQEAAKVESLALREAESAQVQLQSAMAEASAAAGLQDLKTRLIAAKVSIAQKQHAQLLARKHAAEAKQQAVDELQKAHELHEIGVSKQKQAFVLQEAGQVEEPAALMRAAAQAVFDHQNHQAAAVEQSAIAERHQQKQRDLMAEVQDLQHLSTWLEEHIQVLLSLQDAEQRLRHAEHAGLKCAADQAGPDAASDLAMKQLSALRVAAQWWRKCLAAVQTCTNKLQAYGTAGKHEQTDGHSDSSADQLVRHMVACGVQDNDSNPHDLIDDASDCDATALSMRTAGSTALQGNKIFGTEQLPECLHHLAAENRAFQTLRKAAMCADACCRWLGEQIAAGQQLQDMHQTVHGANQEAQVQRRQLQACSCGRSQLSTCQHA